MKRVMDQQLDFSHYICDFRGECFGATGYSLSGSGSASTCDDVMTELCEMRKEMKIQHTAQDCHVMRLQEKVDDLSKVNADITGKLSLAVKLLEDRSLRISLRRTFAGCVLLMVTLLPMALICNPMVLTGGMIVALFVSLLGFIIASSVKV